MRRLQTRIFLHFLGLLVVVGFVNVAVFATGWRSAFPRSLSERLLAFAAAEIADRFEEPHERERAARKMAAHLGVDLTVRDAAGRLLLARGAQLPALTEAELGLAESGATFLRRGRATIVAAPIRDEQSGALLGYVEATPVRRFRSPSPLRPALVAIVALVAAGLLTVPLARRISGPIERLTEASRRFGEGDLAARVPMAPPPGSRRGWRHHRHARIGEIEDLSRAWNDMADRVERLLRGQKELLANVSHELRSPLARVRVALELLPRAPADEARIADIEADLVELERLIDDVLTASRLEVAGLPSHPGPVDVDALLANLCERARLDPLVAGRAVRAEPTSGLILFADGTLLRRALWNLIENAAKYGAPPITLAARIDGDRVTLAVSDEGAGIPSDERERVLDPFVRIDRARTPSGPGEAHRGFGLGLTIARRVAEGHGGTIRVEAARVEGGRERGCRIVLDLPRRLPA